jgi:hypothetical protein
VYDSTALQTKVTQKAKTTFIEGVEEEKGME